MPEPEDFYTPALIDEQIDALLQARNMPVRDLRLANDLHAILEHEDEDARSLQNVLHKLLKDTGEQSMKKIIALSERQQPERIAIMHNNPRPSSPRQAGSMLRVWSTLAAILVIVLLVGSMLLVLNAVRPQKGGTSTAGQGKHTPTTVTHTPASTLPQGQIIYQSAKVNMSMPLSWSPNGKRVATAIDHTTVKSWDALTGKNVQSYKVAGNSNAPGALTVNSVTNVAWSPDGSKLLVAETHTIYLFDASTARLIRTFTPSAQASSAVTTSPLANTHGFGQRVPLTSELPLSATNIFSNAVWSPNGQYIASAYTSGVWQTLHSTITIWDASSGSLVKTLSGFTSNIISVSWSSQENRLAALGYDNVDSVAKVWDTTTWKIIKQYPNTLAFDWSPDGTQLALAEAASNGDVGNSVHIVDASTGRIVKQIATPAMAVRWSPDGTRLAIERSTITIWSVTSGKLLYTFPQPGAYQATWSPDSKYISCTRVGESGSGKKGSLYVLMLIWAA